MDVRASERENRERKEAFRKAVADRLAKFRQEALRKAEQDAPEARRRAREQQEQRRKEIEERGRKAEEEAKRKAEEEAEEARRKAEAEAEEERRNAAQVERENKMRQEKNEAREEEEILSAMIYYWVVNGKFPLKDTSTANDFASTIVYGDGVANGIQMRQKYEMISTKYKRLEKEKRIQHLRWKSPYWLWDAMGRKSAKKQKHPPFYPGSPKEPAQLDYPYLRDGLFRTLKPGIQRKAWDALHDTALLQEFESESRTAAVAKVKNSMEVWDVAREQCVDLLKSVGIS